MIFDHYLCKLTLYKQYMVEKNRNINKTVYYLQFYVKLQPRFWQHALSSYYVNNLIVSIYVRTIRNIFDVADWSTLNSKPRHLYFLDNLHWRKCHARGTVYEPGTFQGWLDCGSKATAVQKLN